MAVHFGDCVAAPLTAAEAAEVDGLSASLISDALNRGGTMDAGIRPIGAAVNFVAAALTVSVMVGDNRALHHAAERVERGQVIVVDGKGDLSTALWGEILHTMARRRGMQALVVDGCIRDAAALADTPVPVWSRGRVPTGPHKGWGGSINVPIQCGGVAVMPGDILVADADGIVVVPRQRWSEIAAGARRQLEAERQMFAAIASGESTVDLLGLR